MGQAIAVAFGAVVSTTNFETYPKDSRVLRYNKENGVVIKCVTVQLSIVGILTELFNVGCLIEVTTHRCKHVKAASAFFNKHQYYFPRFAHFRHRGILISTSCIVCLGVLIFLSDSEKETVACRP